MLLVMSRLMEKLIVLLQSIHEFSYMLFVLLGLYVACLLYFRLAYICVPWAGFKANMQPIQRATAIPPAALAKSELLIMDHEIMPVNYGMSSASGSKVRCNIAAILSLL